MSQPYQPGNAPAYGQPYPAVPQEHPQGTTVLVLGIVGLFVGICAPFAWVMGNRALKEIRGSSGRYANEQQIVIGRILGMIVTILMIVTLVLGLLAAVGLAIFAVSSSG
jgi:small-conductance mechanosensitive channel